MLLKIGKIKSLSVDCPPSGQVRDYILIVSEFLPSEVTTFDIQSVEVEFMLVIFDNFYTSLVLHTQTAISNIS